MEIYGDASSIILNGKEIGKVPWSALPQYIQTGFFGLLITVLATLLSRSNKLFVFFKPPKTGSIFTLGQFVCETRSGYIISGKLKRSPTKRFPYYEFEQAHRKLRSADEWEFSNHFQSSHFFYRCGTDL